MEKEWVKIMTSGNVIEVEIVKQMLLEHDILAVVLNKQDSSYLFGKIELMVKNEDFATATLLMNNISSDHYED